MPCNALYLQVIALLFAAVLENGQEADFLRMMFRRQDAEQLGQSPIYD